MRPSGLAPILASVAVVLATFPTATSAAAAPAAPVAGGGARQFLPAATSFAPKSSAPRALALGARTLRRGSSGTAVKNLQKALTQASCPADVDGRFGAGTEAAVKQFQRARRLRVDGVAGSKIKAALDRALAPGSPKSSRPGSARSYVVMPDFGIKGYRSANKKYRRISTPQWRALGSPRVTPSITFQDAVRLPSVTLDGVTVKLPSGQDTAIVAKQRGGRNSSYASVALFEKTSDGRWSKRITTAKGRLGKTGTDANQTHVPGRNRTPRGSFLLVDAFGNGSAPRGYSDRFTNVDRYHYWNGEWNKPGYNRLVNSRSSGISYVRTDSEHLVEQPVSYRYALATSFNYDNPVKGRSSAIFLHVNPPPGRGTAGCVSVPRSTLEAMMRGLDLSRTAIAMG